MGHSKRTWADNLCCFNRGESGVKWENRGTWTGRSAASVFEILTLDLVNNQEFITFDPSPNRYHSVWF